MIASIVIAALIFAYAGWTLFKFVKKSKKGKCAACALNESCGKSSCAIDAEAAHVHRG